MNDPARRNLNSMDDALGADHERLEGLLSKFKKAVSTQSPGASDEMNRLARGLLHQMSWEDEHLFPAVKGLGTAKERRSIESLEIDHERLRDTLRTTIAQGDYVTAGTLVRRRGTLLKGHNYDEEHGVSVEADLRLNGAERRRRMARFVAGLPKERP